FIDSFDPDLVVSLNYPRTARRSIVPDGTPYVTWVQDQMPGLFKPDPNGDAFSRATNRDFLVGAFSSLVRDTPGYERRCTKRFPVPASTRKFHPGALRAEDRERYSCEIAYVGHQSET